MSYLDRVNDVQTSYNEFKSFLNFYLTTRLNKGFNDVNQAFSDIGLLDLNEFVKDESWLDVSTGSNFPSFFDYPMYVKSYGPGGKLGYGVTPDIGFTRNVEKNLKWTQGIMPSNHWWYSVCYGNGKYVAMSYDSMAYSTDGISWTEGNMPSSQVWCSVCYGNGKFVAVNQSNNTIMAYSTDGISWTQGNMPSSRRWNSVCYGNGKFVAVATNYTNSMAYSTDGISWTEGNMPSSQEWQSVCYGNDKFVVVNESNNTMAYSTDGISWTEGNMPNRQQWESVCYGNGKFVVVARNTDTMAYSTDGISWTEGNMPRSQNWQSVCYGNGKYVVVAQNTNIMAYSTDGISWTEGNMPISQAWNAVCYGNDKYVALAGGNATSNIMAYSTDVYSYPSSTVFNEITVDYQYTDLFSKYKLYVNEPENYYFELRYDTTPLFTVPFPSSSTVQYLRNNYSRLFSVSISDVGNLFIFASFYRSSSYGGLVLYVSPDLIHWNVHQLIPGTATSTEAEALIGTTSSSLSLSSSNATIMQNALRKYVGFLSNGQYVVMYPYEMYKQSGDNMQNMAVLYSPYQSEPLMTINDPYGDEDWENKAINGISAIVDEYGCFDIYYNNRLNCPLSLGLANVINPKFTNQNAGENIGVPTINKMMKSYNGKGVFTTDMTIDTNRDVDSPIGITAICTLDKNSETLEYTPIDVRLCTNVGNYDRELYKSITLRSTEKTLYAGNIDEDMSNYIIGPATTNRIYFSQQTSFVYRADDDTQADLNATARITVIGDTSSNYNQWPSPVD